MRVATYNVHDCVGQDGRFDPARTAHVLTELNADLIALQEVTLDSAGDLVGRFERATALRAIDGTLFERGVGRYGNLLLTRHSVLASRLHDISLPGRERRGVVEMLLDIDDHPLKVFATHLGLKGAERRAQIKRISTLVEDAVDGALLLGDFNIWGWSLLLRHMTDVGFQHIPVRSFPTRPYPLISLDRILARSPVVLSRCWRHESPTARLASDHFPVIADLGFKSAP